MNVQMQVQLYLRTQQVAVRLMFFVTVLCGYLAAAIFCCWPHGGAKWAPLWSVYAAVILVMIVHDALYYTDLRLAFFESLAVPDREAIPGDELFCWDDEEDEEP